MGTKIRAIRQGKKAGESEAQPEPAEQADGQYVDDLLAGKIEAPNQYVADVVDQIRAARKELEALRPRVQELTDAVTQTRQRGAALALLIQQLAANLVRWRDTEGG